MVVKNIFPNFLFSLESEMFELVISQLHPDEFCFLFSLFCLVGIVHSSWPASTLRLRNSRVSAVSCLDFLMPFTSRY